LTITPASRQSYRSNNVAGTQRSHRAKSKQRPPAPRNPHTQPTTFSFQHLRFGSLLCARQHPYSELNMLATCTIDPTRGLHFGVPLCSAWRSYLHSCCKRGPGGRAAVRLALEGFVVLCERPAQLVWVLVGNDKRGPSRRLGSERLLDENPQHLSDCTLYARDSRITHHKVGPRPQAVRDRRCRASGDGIRTRARALTASSKWLRLSSSTSRCSKLSASCVFLNDAESTFPPPAGLP
jgi:hypothetical protein